jgi:hypothetical protein
MDELDRMVNPSHPDVRIEQSIARAEVAVVAMNRDTARLSAAIEATVTDAIAHPEVFVDPERPMTTSERSEFAERAAVADLAVRLNLSETTIRNRFGDALSLRTRLPRLWREFLDGNLSPANAHTAAELAGSLPEGWGRFDDAILDSATTLAPGRFKLRARAIRERIHHVSLTARHKQAAESRGVFLENDLDGMAELAWRGPADQVHRAYQGIDQTARALAVLPGETRTLGQIRSDVTVELLAGRSIAGSPVNVSIAATVPVMTLLGLSEEPAILDGYGPIDAETARRLAAHAPSFTRLLTHPISGALLTVDRGVYRAPADLKKSKEITDVLCGAIGCMRKARNCDLDHTIDFQYGGSTRADNVMHLCRHHHRLKHMTKWKIEQPADGPPVWTSPTGHVREVDAPPF